MLAARLYRDEWDIDARLVAFGVTRAELLEVVRGVVAARADAVPDDPVTASGLFAYIYGTRYLRGLFGSKGWRRHREDNIEAVKHPNRSQKIIYQSVDVACADFNEPRAVSGKGAGSNKMISEGQGDLFRDSIGVVPALVRSQPVNTGAWFFCVSVDGDDVRAELSLPAAVEDGNFKGFIERIYIVRPGEWEGLSVTETGPAPVEFDPIVSRK